MPFGCWVLLTGAEQHDLLDMAWQQIKQTVLSGLTQQDRITSGPDAVFAAKQSDKTANIIEWQSKLAKVPEETASQAIHTCCITWVMSSLAETLVYDDNKQGDD